MEFNWGTAVLAFLFFAAYSELLTTRKLTQKLNDKVDALDALMVNMKSEVELAAFEASEANQAVRHLQNKEERDNRGSNPFG